LGILLVFATAALASALLMFTVEPLLAKMMLPVLGGAPAVWNTALVFFQATLLAGYAFAHGLARLGPRRHALLHVAVIAASWLALPLTLHPVAAGAPPALRVLVLLAAAAGVPFFALATNAPALGRQLASIDHPSARDPYLLYAASNAGSLLALLAYPLLVEPRVPLSMQVRLFGVGYAVLIALIAGCALLVLRGPINIEVVRDRMAIAWRRRARWVLLAAVPSALLVAVTQYLTTDVAAAPLLWTVPLLVYLATFVLVFARRLRPRHALMARVLPLFAVMAALTLVLETRSPALVIALVHVIAFFLAAMVCHGELADDRPPPANLTEFYFWLSVGGVLGGLVVALLAPVILDRNAEYPVILVLALFLRPAPAERSQEGGRRGSSTAEPKAARTAAFVVGVGVLEVIAVLVADHYRLEGALLAACVSVPVFAMYRTLVTPKRFALALGAILLAGTLHQPYGVTLLRTRNFFGALRVVRDPSGRFTQLVHGTTIHGRQSVDPLRRRESTSYYHSTGPIGDVFARYDARMATESPSPSPAVGIVGLGAGSIAAYARGGERWTYFEIDPDVIRIASDPKYFTFLSDAFPGGVGLHIDEGDARLRLAKTLERFSVLVIDAFSSDAIPVHLLTVEAMRVYASHLDDGGLLAWHISNNYLDLEPVLAALASEAGFVAFVREDWAIDDEHARHGKSPSTWAVMARNPADLGGTLTHGPWHPAVPSPAIALWTDDQSSIVPLLLHRK
jgi:hypothetical protein